VILGAAVVGDASWGGARPGGGSWRSLPARARGQKKHPPEAQPGGAPAAPGRCAW